MASIPHVFFVSNESLADKVVLSQVFLQAQSGDMVVVEPQNVETVQTVLAASRTMDGQPKDLRVVGMPEHVSFQSAQILKWINAGLSNLVQPKDWNFLAVEFDLLARGVPHDKRIAVMTNITRTKAAADYPLVIE